MTAGSRTSIDAVRLWTAVLSITYALALPEILWIMPAVLKDERLAPLAAPFVAGTGLSSLVAKLSATESPQQLGLALVSLIMTIVLISYLHLKISLLQDERNCLNAFQEEQEQMNAQNRQRELEAQAQRARWVEREKARLRQMEDDWRQQMEKAEKKSVDWQAQIEAAWQERMEALRPKQMELESVRGEMDETPAERRRITVPLEVELSNQPIHLTQEASVPINRSMAMLRRDRDTREVLKRINEADQLCSLFQLDQTVMADNVSLPASFSLERASSGGRVTSGGH